MVCPFMSFSKQKNQSIGARISRVSINLSMLAWDSDMLLILECNYDGW
jgi:hypothetical protein